jgi:mannose-6-phosphate isomerase-like protein (cupin superfamily)
MKKYSILLFVSIASFIAGTLIAFAYQQEPGYILEHEKDIAKAEPAPHKGLGNTTAFKFFAGSTGSKFEFRKRVLHKGASIGYHLQKEEEIYYIDSGQGTMQMNGNKFDVKAGDAILTHGGSSHGLIQVGEEDLVVIIVYEKK